MPDGRDEAAPREVVYDSYAMSLGSGLASCVGAPSPSAARGDFEDLSLMATLSGVELGPAAAGVPHRTGGVAAALEVLQSYG